MNIATQGLALDLQTIRFPDLEMSEELVRRFDRSGPRYTSYPTADRFEEQYPVSSYLAHLARRAAAR